MSEDFEERSDEEIVDHVTRTGDVAAFWTVYIRHLEPLTAKGLALGLDLDAADEIAHFALVGSQRKWRSREEGRSFRQVMMKVWIEEFAEWSRRRGIRER